MNKKQVKSSLLLLLTALIWGFAFAAQSIGMNYVGQFTFNAVRFLIGALVLIPVIMLLDKAHGRKPSLFGTEDRKERSDLIKGGLLCGIIMTFANSFQMAGLKYTTVGKAGFITVLYIIIVPLIGIAMKKPATYITWISVALALGGIYLLCVKEDFTINKGDLLVMVCAVLFSFHIIVTDHYSKLVDCVRMSCIQFLVCGILCSVMMFITEKPTVAAITGSLIPILYSGILSSGVAYTLQIVAQKDLPASTASLIMSMESVFAVIAGWIVLKETTSLKEIIGCLLVFIAIILVQLPVASHKKTVLKRS
jgi:drug/metabolite transporter (DMT)-like permease